MKAQPCKQELVNWFCALQSKLGSPVSWRLTPRQMKELVEKYGEVKADQLRKRCEQAGQWKWDKNFPKDKDEILYVVYKGFAAEESNMVRQTEKLQAQKDSHLAAQCNFFPSTHVKVCFGLGCCSRDLDLRQPAWALQIELRCRVWYYTSVCGVCGFAALSPESLVLMLQPSMRC